MGCSRSSWRAEAEAINFGIAFQTHSAPGFGMSFQKQSLLDSGIPFQTQSAPIFEPTLSVHCYPPPSSSAGLVGNQGGTSLLSRCGVHFRRRRPAVVSGTRGEFC
eukprot:8819459-Pyramimonas_sp.AAC.1